MGDFYMWTAKIELASAKGARRKSIRGGGV